MIFFLAGFAMLGHVLFWGVGLAALVLPRPWRRFWPVFIPLCGFALQGAVVWAGCYLNFRGTNAYAWPSEAVPALLLATALARLGVRRWRQDLGRFALVWAALAAVLALTLLPLALASAGLTTTSLGSCDAADYAAGARLFMEFAHSDRAGFLGLSEVVRIMSVDNFFDFWLRLNHFTPSAIIALNGTILHCAPHELTGIMTAVVLAASVPMVFWIARALFGYSAIPSLAIAGLYGISPIAWYSFAQVSPAPLLAAIAIAALNWAAIALWHTRWSWRRALAFAPLLIVTYSVILGGYNFILLVALTPALAYAFSRAAVTGRWRALAGWLVALALPLIVAALIFWARTAGLVERFLLFRAYDFGWKIPPLGPEGWLGLVAGPTLAPWPFILRWPLAVLVVAALTWSVAATIARRRRVWLLACIVLPVLAGYLFLEVRGVIRHTNASYDAFKLFAVFYPLLLPAFCWWITLRMRSQLLWWLAVAAFAALVVLGNIVACGWFVVALSRPPLAVDGELRQLRRVEAMPDIASVNVLLPDMWSRLWANELLLRKPQYFLTHTYEGRLNTPLRGAWDLVETTIASKPTGQRRVTAHYVLNDTRAPDFLRVLPGAGWYAEERVRSGDRWSWTRNDATFIIENPHAAPLTARVHLDARALAGRDVMLLGANGLAAATVHVGPTRAESMLRAIVIPPGKSEWRLHSAEPDSTAPGDARELSLCIFRLEIESPW